jgi:hypothetical protein
MDTLSFLIVALICLALGFLGGALLSPFRSDEEGQKTDENAQIEDELEEVVRIWRDWDKGELLIKMEGQKYMSPEELNDEQRSEIDLVWQKLRMKTSESPTAVSEVALTATPEPEITSDQEPQSSAFLKDTQTPKEESPQAEVKPVSVNPVSVFARALASDVPKVEPEEKSIVAQIDEVLQAKIAGTSLVERGIRLKDSPDGGVIVVVDTEEYEGVDGVPDEEIQNLIRSSVVEWERKTS